MQELAEGRRATAEATRACEAKDWTTCLDALDRAIARRPGHPDPAPAARPRAGPGRSRPEALSAFERLAAMGLVFPIEDTALATLAPPEQARLTEVRARVARNGAPTGERQVGFTLPGPNDMVPEGLAWDPKADVFYVGGVHRPGIVRVIERGPRHPIRRGRRARAPQRAGPGGRPRARAGCTSRRARSRRRPGSRRTRSAVPRCSPSTSRPAARPAPGRCPWTGPRGRSVTWRSTRRNVRS